MRDRHRGPLDELYRAALPVQPPVSTRDSPDPLPFGQPEQRWKVATSKSLSDGAKSAIGIVIAGVLIAAAILFRPVADRYSFRVNGGEVQRFDSVSGEILVCPKGADICTELANTRRGLKARPAR